MKKFKSAIPLAIVALVIVSSSCQKLLNLNPGSYNQVKSIQLKTDAKLGSILTDSAGKSLYFFSIDASGASGCSGACSVAWPPFYSANPSFAAGLSPLDFAVITNSNGSKQTTYKGWPLYYFKFDAKPGDVTGDGVEKVWFVAKPDYSVMLANTQLVGLDGKDYVTSAITPGMGLTQYITDPYGKTLYSFIKDKFKKNNFTAADYSNNKFFPLDSIKAVMNVPSILDKTQLDAIMVDGRTQLTFKGWPLYYFFQDSLRGNTKGISVPSAGVWPIKNLDSPVAPAN